MAIDRLSESTAIALSLVGLIGPIGATVISNGSAIAATLNGLRPLFHRMLQKQA